jgi:hypothetical protein
MKSIFFIALICSIFLTISSASAQSDFYFNFQIHINGVDYGYYDVTTTVAGALQKVNSSQPDLPTLCPGDEITLKNKCVYNYSAHSFDGINNTFNRPTIGLTSTMGCSNPYPPANYISILHLADVCGTACNYLPPAPTYQTFNNWNYNSSVTVTYHYTPNTYNYLVIDAGGTSNVIGNCGCGHRLAYLPLTFGEKPTTIDNASICPSDLVNLNLNPDCTYSNWVPNNPTGSTLNTTTNYSVDITNTTSGCSINDDFTVYVQTPDSDLSIINQLCYDESFQITEDDFYNLYSSNTSPSQILVNGVLIADGNTTMNLPHEISGQNYNSGIVTVEYIYIKNGISCSKTYEVIIHPEIMLTLQDSYEFCNGNFQTLFATPNGIIGQAGISYNWSKSGVPFSLGMSPYFTPSSYGTYHLIAYDAFGCQVRHTFTVSDPGLGVKHPSDITFCSINEPAPSYIGWYNNPSKEPCSFLWTYTDENGNTSFANTSTPYNTYYQGPGTYTVIITAANGCADTINIVVTDLAQIYNNHYYASFNFTPLGGNQVSCQPNMALLSTDTWIVTNLSTNTPVSTTPNGSGIIFNYTLGVQYSVKLERSIVRTCRTFINQFTWVDNVRVIKRNNSSDDNSPLNLESTTIQTFPNPTTGLVNIQLKHAETAETNIEVLNSLGQIILKKQIQNKDNIEIDLSKEISGVYILHIVNGNTQFTEKVIKE